MFEDPIVEEIRAIRQRLAAECDFDVHKILARAREHEKRHPERVVCLKPDSEQKRIVNKGADG